MWSQIKRKSAQGTQRKRVFASNCSLFCSLPTTSAGVPTYFWKVAGLKEAGYVGCALPVSPTLPASSPCRGMRRDQRRSWGGGECQLLFRTKTVCHVHAAHHKSCKNCEQCRLDYTRQNYSRHSIEIWQIILFSKINKTIRKTDLAFEMVNRKKLLGLKKRSCLSRGFKKRYLGVEN